MSVTTLPEVTESTVEELAIQRYLLDLVLQPLDRFDGFTHREQFICSALRFQLNFIGYALAMAQYTRTPAFTGYLREAQANAIAKMCDKRVWSYWSKENLVGYQRWNPDPIVRANVMYTGFFGVMLAMFESMNGDDRRFDEPGSLRLQWDHRTRYDYDFGSIVEAIRRNMMNSRHTQYPCEPHLIYPMCNAFAINTLPAYDRLHEMDVTGDLVDRVRDSYDRFGYLRSNGRFVCGRGPLGLVFPPLVGNDAIMASWLHPVMPDLAERSWDVVRERFVELGDDGSADLRGLHVERIDLGSYVKGDGPTRAAVLCAAKEMGDDEAARAVERSMDERFGIDRSPGGARKYRNMSTWANTMFALAAFTRTNGISDLLTGKIPMSWTTGPVLACADYPEVLVARAVTDGTALDLVLRPGNGPVRTTLGIERLAPGQRYRVVGVEAPPVVADDVGTADIEIALSDRLQLKLVPDDGRSSAGVSA